MVVLLLGTLLRGDSAKPRDTCLRGELMLLIEGEADDVMLPHDDRSIAASQAQQRWTQ